MSVLYQVPHGQRRDSLGEASRQGIHTLLTVQCQESVLNVHPAPSEGSPHQIRALRDGISRSGAHKVLMICSDSPSCIDTSNALWETFPNLQCVGKDLLNIALKVEQATNEHPTRFSIALRRCLQKLRLGGFGQSRYVRKAVNVVGSSELSTVMSAQSASRIKQRYENIGKDRYVGQPYDKLSEFVCDVAAICNSHPDIFSRRVGKGSSTVLTSLEFATSRRELAYFKNFCKFVDNNPSIAVMFGTTRNEAFHKQLKAFYRNVFHQTSRHAQCIANVATLAKLLAGYLQRSAGNLVRNYEEHDVLVALAKHLLAERPIPFKPRMRHAIAHNEPVDVESLPRNVKRMRKR